MSKNHEENKTYLSDLSEEGFHLPQLSLRIPETGEAVKKKKIGASLVLFTQNDDIYTIKSGATDELDAKKRDFTFNLPEEIIIEVLSRLPLKTLARFKCVSTRWQFLILNSVHVSKSPKLLIFARYNGKFGFHSIDSETHHEKMSTPMDEYLLHDHKVIAHSSCHGLVVVQIDNDLFLWNPLTSFIRKVLTYKGLANMDIHSGSSSFIVDLCYCSVNDEYKVVLVTKTWSISWNTQDFYVATCGDNEWRELEIWLACLGDMSPGPFYNGYRHWINRYVSSGTGSDLDIDLDAPICSWKCIMYFDPSINKFIGVPKPQPKKRDSDTFLSLGVYDECLSVTRWDDPENYEGDIELLVMREYGNENSWEVLFVFSNTPEFRCYGDMEPLFKTKKGEILVRMDMCFGACSVKAYDVHGNFLRDIFALTSDKYLLPDSYLLKVVSYEENWISPINHHCKEGLHGRKLLVEK